MLGCGYVYCALGLPLERLDQTLGLAFDFEDLDGAVARTGREASAIVVEDGIVLEGKVMSAHRSKMGLCLR